MSSHLKTHLYLHALTTVFPYQRARIIGLISQLVDGESLISQHSFLPLHKLSNEIAFIWNRMGTGEMRRSGMIDDDISRFQESRKNLNIENEYCDLMKNNITMLCLDDEQYPEKLKHIHAPPLCIYTMGETALLQKSYVGIVGTRMPSAYGVSCTQHIIREMKQYDVGIVSGLALGIDRIAHQNAIEHGIPTVGVLGHGHIHLDNQLRSSVVRDMLSSQLIISEYPPRTTATKFTFPMRNRIISGLAKGVLIIEARRASGALITAKHAFEQGRDVFAVPGSIFNPCSQGNHEIIRSQTAHVFSTTNDLMDEMGFAKKSFSLEGLFC